MTAEKHVPLKLIKAIFWIGVATLIVVIPMFLFLAVWTLMRSGPALLWCGPAS
jgi:hypothetical protein